VAEGAGVAPAAGLRPVREWTREARAAIFVARGSLARERETIVRQANELGTAVLGEPVTALTVAAVTERVGGERG
jgi:hypothetical protein